MAGIIVAMHRVVGAARFQSPGVVASVGGVSLVEVLISTTLLAGAMVSLPQLFAIAARANLEAGHVTAATLLAAQKIEELRSGHFRPLSARGVEFLDATGESIDVSGSAPVFTRTWWMAPLSSAPDTTIAIGVAVSRSSRAESERGDAATGAESARLVTLWTKKGHDD